MKLTITPLVAVLFGLALSSMNPAGADDAHHQPDAGTAVLPTAMPAEPPAGQMMMPMMNMMTMMGHRPGGMPMMDMMGQSGMGMMGMMGPGVMPMMGMADHLEGRIAFLRAELGITEAQTAAWDRFAQVLRDAAPKTQHDPASADQTANGATDVLQRMEQEEQKLGARLQAIKSVRAAFAELHAVLSDDQKSTAEVLLTQPVCLAMGVL